MAVDEDARRLSPTAREFLFAEYARIGADFVANESMGDGRATLFVTLWAAGVAGATAIRTSVELEQLILPLVIGLTGLALLGLVTLNRLFKRTTTTDRLADALARLRLLLIGQDLAIQAALPWGDNKVPKLRRGAIVHRRSTTLPRMEVGLVQTIAVLNAGTAMLIWFVLLPGEETLIWLPGLVGVIVQLVAVSLGYGADYRSRKRTMARFLKGRHQTAREQVDLSAGAIVTRRQRGDLQVAIVERSRHGGDFGLPKGHPEGDESLEEAVVREVQEETGFVVPRPGRPDLVDAIAYLAGDTRTPKIVVFYALPAGEQRTSVRDAESSAVHWLHPEKAIEALSYPKEKALVAEWMKRRGDITSASS